MITTASGMTYEEVREEWMPKGIMQSQHVLQAEKLLEVRPACISFRDDDCVRFEETGSYVILDYGKELCGGIRILTRNTPGIVKWHITFGESLTECCAKIGEKNATNDHSPRDMEVVTGMMSDLVFGQTGFRFVRIELIEGAWAMLQSIFAVSILPHFEREAEITTDDELLNEIIQTAAYTLKLNFQNGYIWDGIKRDRLVWCGDLHPEIVTSLYLFGDNENITNSLRFLRESTPAQDWMNWLPAYSAWWVINLCDYCRITGNHEFFEENREYAQAIIRHFDQCIKDDGSMNLADGGEMEFFLDWSTLALPESVAGVASLIILMAKRYLAVEEHEVCRKVIKKLEGYLEVETIAKPIRAFQVLAGRDHADDAEMLQTDGAKGFSTFMAYYILLAMSDKGSDMLPILKEYYGGMLACGATTFWEDFDVEWLPNSARIDEFPKEGQNDLHGDFGMYCYKNFRHSLCHGWSSGVVAFIIEYILGIHIEDGGKKVHCNPHSSGLKEIHAKLPLRDGWLEVCVHDGEVKIHAPEATVIVME